ncbi:MAG: hypothetical protein ACJAWS_002661, partial [Oleiphilaceae bacterium]
MKNIVLFLHSTWPKANFWPLSGTVLCMAYLSGCATSSAPKLTLSDLGTRYWQGTFYLSVEGLPSSIQCDVNIAYQSLVDVFVRYKGKDAEVLFDSDEDKAKIQALKQKCLDKSIFK